MASTLVLDELGRTINEYWDNRAQTYSNGICDELAGYRRCSWQRVLAHAIADELEVARAKKRALRALDLGCGPGFFCILLADEGCVVDAVDMSAQMLARAKSNAGAAVPHAHITFHQCDAADLPFANDTFDLAVSRNLTWLMRNPEHAYVEWLRVLRPGGKLLVFDANWYRYLVDERVDAARRSDQEKGEVYDERSRATEDEERRCERIAAELPLTPVMRPEWDIQTLERLGAAYVGVNEDAWLELWTTGEQEYYGSSPLFMIEARK